MTKVLTGIQSSGLPHLGNILGAILPAISMSTNCPDSSYYFIADFHSLTSVKDPDERLRNTYSIAATWLAFGLSEEAIFYRQSKVPEVCELAWYLSCYTPYPMLANSHSFKSKSNSLASVSAGLLTYPILMAADILIFDADVVPVGKDQMQHLEITRDIARFFNNKYGNVFKYPKAKIDENLSVMPGIDGRKMSKSYNNIINIFLPEKQLRKVIMSIKTDSLPLSSPKDPFNCNVFKIYSMLASSERISEMKHKYEKGNFGYGEAKEELFNLIIKKFNKERFIFNNLVANPSIIEKRLKNTEEKAKSLAVNKIKTIRKILGY